MRDKRNDEAYLDASLKDLKKKIFKNPKYDSKADKDDLNGMDFTSNKEEN